MDFGDPESVSELSAALGGLNGLQRSRVCVRPEGRLPGSHFRDGFVVRTRILLLDMVIPFTFS